MASHTKEAFDDTPLSAAGWMVTASKAHSAQRESKTTTTPVGGGYHKAQSTNALLQWFHTRFLLEPKPKAAINLKDRKCLLFAWRTLSP